MYQWAIRKCIICHNDYQPKTSLGYMNGVCGNDCDARYNEWQKKRVPTRAYQAAIEYMHKNKPWEPGGIMDLARAFDTYARENKAFYR